MDRDKLSNLHRGPAIDASHQVSEEKIFLKSTNQKQELSVAAMFVNGSGWNEQSLQGIFHRCFLPGFGSFGQAVSEEKTYKNRPIRNKNCLWRPYLLMDRDEMSKFYRGHSIDASYQVSVHLAKGFQRRRLKCEKLTDDWCQSSHCLFFLFRSNNQFTTEDSDFQMKSSNQLTTQEWLSDKA